VVAGQIAQRFQKEGLLVEPVKARSVKKKVGKPLQVATVSSEGIEKSLRDHWTTN